MVGWEPPSSGAWGFLKATEQLQPRVEAAQGQIQILIHVPVSLF